VEGAVVVLSGPVQRTTTTSATGEFRFNDVPDGDYQLQVKLPAGRTDISIPEAQRVSLVRGDAWVDVDLVARSTARVTGVLVDERGRPVAVGVPRPGQYRPFAPALALVDAIPTSESSPVRRSPWRQSSRVGSSPSPYAGRSRRRPTCRWPASRSSCRPRTPETPAAGVPPRPTPPAGSPPELYRGVRYRVWARAGSRWAAPIEIVAGDAPIVLTLTPPR
jgi:hypothetical protein